MELNLNIMGILTSVSIFFAPLELILILVTLLCILDCLTAIWSEISDVSGIRNKIKKIESKKLRRTTTKILFYTLILGAIFSIFKICIGENAAVYIVKLSALFLSINELYSIGENMGMILKKNIFVRLIRFVVAKTLGWSNEKMNKLIEGDEKGVEDGKK